MRNLFANFPLENLMFIHRDPSVKVPSELNSFFLSNIRFRIDLICFIRLFCAWLLASYNGRRLPSLGDVKTLLVGSGYFSVRSAYKRQVAGFGPEIIYAWASSPIWIRTVERLASAVNAGIVVHFMDNHASQVYGSPGENVVGKLYRKMLLELSTCAAGRITITNAMREAYKLEFEFDSTVFHAAIDLRELEHVLPRSEGAGFVLLYSGSIDQGQLAGLLDVARAVEALIAKNRNGYTLEIWTSYSYLQHIKSSFASFRGTKIYAYKDEVSLPQLMSRADLLLLAYGFDKKTVDYFRFSFPTKVIPYMLSGRCILAYGPADIEPIRYVAEGGWGIAINDQQVESLSSMIEFLRASPELCHELGTRARRVAFSEHDGDDLARRFCAYLTTCATRSH